MSLAQMKKQNSLDKLLGAAQSETQPQEKKSYVDERIWKPELDKTGNGYAVIRFLPAVSGEDMPWAKLWNHAFQGPTGQWYIENSLTTLGQNDPVSEMNSAYWNSGVESDKEIARRQKRKLQYYSNIYVVSDSKHPEREGKVFLYRFGKKIFDKIMEAMQPVFDDEEPINPFDFWQGANFKLKIRKVDGYWNYDKSEFEGPSPLFDNDDEIEEVWKNQYALKEFTATTNFKSYDELKTRLNIVLAGTTTVGNATTLLEDESVADVVVDTKVAPTPKVSVDDDDQEETLDYFQKLADG
ncbi:MAG: single-stranded DNA-binding protein [Candidatus Pacebacteria bacterium]|nr:single-stranded DNA-binding protein [Candidatus Paceibacterota bacterium]